MCCFKNSARYVAPRSPNGFELKFKYLKFPEINDPVFVKTLIESALRLQFSKINVFNDPELFENPLIKHLNPEY